MSTRQTMRKCSDCGKMTMHVQPGTSHLLHFLLSVITVGIWVPFWFLFHLNNNTAAQCTVCGKTKGLSGALR